MISEAYVVKFLLQRTKAGGDAKLKWKKSKSGGYETEIRGIGVGLRGAFCNTGSFGLLLLSLGDHTASIHVSPVAKGRFFWEDRDSNRDALELAGLMDELTSAVSEQCFAREMEAIEKADEIKADIFQKLLFG